MRSVWVVARIGGSIFFPPLLSSIPLYEYTTTYLSILLWMAIWAVSIFLTPLNKVAINVHTHVFVWAHELISPGYF